MTKRYSDQFFDSLNSNLSESFNNDYNYNDFYYLTVAALYKKEQSYFDNENNTLLLDISSIKYTSSLKESNNEKQILLNDNEHLNDDINFEYNQIPKISSMFQYQTRNSLNLNVSDLSTVVSETINNTQSNIALFNNDKNNEWYENCLNYVETPNDNFVSKSSTSFLKKHNFTYQKLQKLKNDNFFPINLNKNESFEKKNTNFFTNNLLIHSKNFSKATSNIDYNSFNKELIEKKIDSFDVNIFNTNNFDNQNNDKSSLTEKIVKNKKLIKLNKHNLKKQKENLILIKNFKKFPKKRICFTKNQTLRLKFFLFSNILVS